ncbi:single-stranded DNA-binding protein [Staphylococcus aureus]|nr:single-stranded DNA-binding protein [Staphylococcus aureus]
MTNKSQEFKDLLDADLAIAFNLAVGTEFTISDLTQKSGITCSIDVQREVGRWFAYFVKHAPRVPFVIIGKNSHGHLVYLKTGPNPYNNSNTSKGGDC